MAPALALALALAAAVCFLLVAPAPARRPADLPPQVVVLPPDAVEYREAAAEPLLLPKPAADADADLTTTAALAVPEEERGPARPRSSLLCLVFRCDDGDEANAVAVRKSGDSQDGGWWPRPAGKGKGSHSDSDSDSDSDCESDSDDEEEGEGGIVGWFWSLAHRF